MSRLAVAASLGLLLAPIGCVTTSTYDEVVRDRDALATSEHRLEQEVERLSASNESLDSERVALIDELEDLRSERGRLEDEVASLSSTAGELATTLADAESLVQEQGAEVERLRSTYHGLVADLESEVAAGQIEIEQLREGVRVNVSDEILFASGSASLDKIGRDVLEKVAGRLVGNVYLIEVQGHTDSVAIRGTLAKRYPSNWELAGARAASVVRLFSRAGVEGKRMTAVSFAEHHPIAPNDSVENRWRNRRIEIRLHPDRGARDEVVTEPASPAAGARGGD